VKWEIQKDAIERAVKIVNQVPARNGIRASEFIKISKHEKTGATLSLSSDMNAEAIIVSGERYPFAGDVFLDRRLFVPFVDAGRESKADTYSFQEKDDGTILVRHGNRKAAYEKAKHVSGYESVPVIKNSQTASLNKRWISLVDIAKMCATDDPVAAQYNCVYLSPTKKNLEVLSSNNKVIFRGRSALEKGINNIAFPLLLVDCLEIEEAKRLVWNEKIAMIEFSKGHIWQTVKVAARKNFPLSDIRALVAKSREYPVAVSINATALARAAARISAYVAALSRETLVFQITLEKGSKRIIIESGANASKFN
jgi:hypothetical protein